jgi:hypothetical protein
VNAAYLPLCILLIVGSASAPEPEVRTADASGWEQKIWYPGDRVPSRVFFRIPGAMKRLAVN